MAPPPNREERRQMRQRGAASRTVNPVDFGISFEPTPASARRRSRRTPTPTLNVRRGSKSKTPGTGGKRGRRSNSVQQTPGSNAGETAGGRRSASLQDFSRTPGLREISGNIDKARSTGKRKGSNDEVVVGKVKRRKTAHLEAVDEGEPSGTQTFGSENIAEPAQNVEKENFEPQDPISDFTEAQKNEDPQQKSTKKRRKRKSIGQARKKRRSSGETSTSSAPIEMADAEPSVLADSPELASADSVEANMRPETQPIDVDGEWEDEKEGAGSIAENAESPKETSQQIPDSGRKPRRKKRKSIGQQKKKRRSSDLQIFEAARIQHEPETPQPEGGRKEPADHYPTSLHQSSPSTSEVRPRRRLSTDLNDSKAGPVDSDESEWEPADADEDQTEQLEIDETLTRNSLFSKESTSSAARRSNTKSKKRSQTETNSQPKKARGRSSAASESTSHQKRQDNDPIPILVHRHINLPFLPTIVEEPSTASRDDEEESLPFHRTDPLQDSFTTRQTPNAIDVLAQICRETVESTIETLPSHLPSSMAANNKSSKIALGRQRAALETFGDKIEDRLFQMSQLLDQKSNLEKRVKSSKKQRADVQARWFAVKKRREEVALKTDEVRRKNWEMEAEVEGRRALSWAAGKVEAGLQKDEPEEEAGLEFRIRYVAEKVGRGEEGGLLERVKALNETLEDMANALEGR